MLEKFVKKLVASENGRLGNPPVTVAFLGDSVTQGCFEIYKTGEKSIETVFDPQSAYANRFNGLLRIIFPRAQINVINAGISGDNAPSGLKRLDRDVLAFSPDLLVVSYGLNDVHRRSDGLDDYIAALKSIFGKAKEKNAEVVFLTQNMMNTRVRYDSDPFFTELGKSMSDVQNGGFMDTYMNAAKNAAYDSGVVVCDCYKKWKRLAEIGADTTALLANGVNHPLRDMHAIIASSLLETVLFE